MERREFSRLFSRFYGILSAKFNPQIKGIHEINFDYMLESNQENLKKLIGKTIDMYVKNIKEL